MSTFVRELGTIDEEDHDLAQMCGCFFPFVFLFLLMLMLVSSEDGWTTNTMV